MLFAEQIYYYEKDLGRERKKVALLKPILVGEAILYEYA